MKNWLGQDIELGSLVYRGAREGNGSSFKIGKVTKFELDKPPRVQWLYEIGPGWAYVDGQYQPTGEKWHKTRKTGSPALDSLVLIDPTTFGFTVEGI